MRVRRISFGIALTGALGAMALAPGGASAAECSIDNDGVDAGNVPALLDSGGYE